MAVVLICSNHPLDRELVGTVLFRAGIQREMVQTVAEVQTHLNAGGVALVCLHRHVPGIEALITSVRRSATLRRVSIVVLSEAGVDQSAIDLLEAGANAILRLPPADDFDARVGRLIDVPARRDVRFPVRLQVTATLGFGTTVVVIARNLSSSGILIETNHSLRMGDEIHVDFRFEESGDVFSANAQVMRTAGQNRYGARFTSITRGEEALTTFLASTSPA